MNSNVTDYVRLSPDFPYLVTDAVLGGAYFLTALNCCLIVFALYILSKIKCKSFSASMVVFTEGVVAAFLRAFLLATQFPGKYRTSPAEFPFFLTPGVDTVASLDSSIILSGVYGRVALGHLGTIRAVSIAVSLISFSATIAITVAMLYLMAIILMQISVDPVIKNGMMFGGDVSKVGALLEEMNKMVITLKEIGSALSVTVVAIFIVLTLVVAGRVFQAVK